MSVGGWGCLGFVIGLLLFLIGYQFGIADCVIHRVEEEEKAESEEQGSCLEEEKEIEPEWNKTGSQPGS